jgi:hypothetical protein
MRNPGRRKTLCKTLQNNQNSQNNPLRRDFSFKDHMGSTEEPGGRRNADTLLRAINNLQTTLDERHFENTSHLEALEEKVDRILRGFPDEDPDAHCRYHESIIEWRELRNKMVREALIKMAGAGAIGAVGWLAVAGFQALKISLKQ